MNARAITASYATDRPGGFPTNGQRSCARSAIGLRSLADTHIQRQIAERTHSLSRPTDGFARIGQQDTPRYRRHYQHSFTAFADQPFGVNK